MIETKQISDNLEKKQPTWASLHPESRAKTARAYYDRHKDDPVYMKILSDRSKARRQRIREAKALLLVKVERVEEAPPKKEPKTNGRPRKYP